MEVFDARSRNLKYAPTIGVNRANNQFQINITAMEILGLKHGDRVAVGYDEGENRWVLFVDEVNGMEVKNRSKGKGLYFNCKALVDRMVEVGGLEEFQSFYLRVEKGKSSHNGNEVVPMRYSQFSKR